MHNFYNIFSKYHNDQLKVLTFGKKIPFLGYYDGGHQPGFMVNCVLHLYGFNH